MSCTAYASSGLGTVLGTGCIVVGYVVIKDVRYLFKPCSAIRTLLPVVVVIIAVDLTVYVFNV